MFVRGEEGCATVRAEEAGRHLQSHSSVLRIVAITHQSASTMRKRSRYNAETEALCGDATAAAVASVWACCEAADCEHCAETQRLSVVLPDMQPSWHQCEHDKSIRSFRYSTRSIRYVTGCEAVERRHGAETQRVRCSGI